MHGSESSHGLRAAITESESGSIPSISRHRVGIPISEREEAKESERERKRKGGSERE
jgi:hypothetical protein